MFYLNLLNSSMASEFFYSKLSKLFKNKAHLSSIASIVFSYSTAFKSSNYSYSLIS